MGLTMTSGIFPAKSGVAEYCIVYTPTVDVFTFETEETVPAYLGSFSKIMAPGSEYTMPNSTITSDEYFRAKIGLF